MHQREQGAVPEIPPERSKFGGLAETPEPLEIMRQPVNWDRLDFRLGLES